MEVRVNLDANLFQTANVTLQDGYLTFSIHPKCTQTNSYFFKAKGSLVSHEWTKLKLFKLMRKSCHLHHL